MDWSLQRFRSPVRLSLRSSSFWITSQRWAGVDNIGFGWGFHVRCLQQLANLVVDFLLRELNFNSCNSASGGLLTGFWKLKVPHGEHLTTTAPFKYFTDPLHVVFESFARRCLRVRVQALCCSGRTFDLNSFPCYTNFFINSTKNSASCSRLNNQNKNELEPEILSARGEQWTMLCGNLFVLARGSSKQIREFILREDFPNLVNLFLIFCCKKIAYDIRNQKKNFFLFTKILEGKADLWEMQMPMFVQSKRRNC